MAGTSGSNRLNEVFTAPGIQFAFGPSFSWPILNYGQITNNVRVQDARLQTLLIDYQNTVLKAQQEVENSLSAFLQGRQQVELFCGGASPRQTPRCALRLTSTCSGPGTSPPC